MKFNKDRGIMKTFNFLLRNWAISVFLILNKSVFQFEKLYGFNLFSGKFVKKNYYEVK
jgi:hypothetical protein